MALPTQATGATHTAAVPTRATGATHTAAPAAHASPARAATAPASSASSVPSSARTIVASFLDKYGLGSMFAWAWGQYVKLGGGQGAIQAITFELPQQQAFKNRFPAYDVLAKQGDAWSVNMIMDYERSVRQILTQAGAPPDLTSNAYIQKLLAENKSVAEISQRASMAAQAATSSHQTVDALKSMYGVQSNHLAAFFMDPDVMLPKLTQMWTSGQIAGEAATQGFGPLSRSEAEGLAAAGVSDSQAQQGFAQLAQNAGLEQAQTAGEGTMSRGTELGLVQGLGAAQQAFARRQQNRQAAFSGGAGFGNVGQGGATGFGQNG